jgi:hypothetical protein
MPMWTLDCRTMKRRLYDKLVLLVKAPLLVNASASASSSSDSDSSGGMGWGFPMAEHQEGESIRATAERALAAAIGPAQVSWRGWVGGWGCTKSNQWRHSDLSALLQPMPTPCLDSVRAATKGGSTQAAAECDACKHVLQWGCAPAWPPRCARGSGPTSLRALLLPAACTPGVLHRECAHGSPQIEKRRQQQQ